MAGASRSRNVNRYVRVSLKLDALRRAVGEASADLHSASLSLKGGQFAEAQRILNDTASATLYNIRVRVTTRGTRQRAASAS